MIIKDYFSLNLPKKEIHIGQKVINDNSPVFLIAEAGVNHNGSLELAKKLVKIALDAKVDAVKFQTFNPEKLMLKSTPKVSYQKESTNSEENFYDMIKKYVFSKEEFEILKKDCEKKKLIFLSTPFDDDSVNLLDKLDVPAFKVGSGDMNNIDLLNLICSKKKPIFLSTGMSTLDEVKESVNFIESKNIKELVIFQCTTNYPSSYDEVNLNVIDTYKNEFQNYFIGFSDHSMGIVASLGAVAKGAKVIEKHFTLDKNMEGPDHKASLDPIELNNWVRQIRILEKILGSNKKFPSKNEIKIAKIARKSIVSVRQIYKGDIFKRIDIAIKRPGLGIEPKFINEVIGKKAKRDIKKDSLIYWEDLE